MTGSITLGFAALLTMLPAALLPSRATDGGARNGLFWLLIAVATVGPLALEVFAGGTIWRTGFSATLWTIVAATMVVYLAVCLVSRTARGLRLVLLPYLVGFGLIALLWSSVPDEPLPASAMTAWLQLHIGVSVATYALITVAAAAAVAVWFKERALRRHAVPEWIDNIPSVADGEKLQFRLLVTAEVILGLGLLTGVATQFVFDGTLVALDHKTVLSVAAFVVLGVLLVLQQGSGLRGRRASRFVLVGYLLITLAFPGVKFVTDVLLG